MKNGVTYRGTLEEAQDNMNCTMKDVIKITPDGKESRIEIAYVRGSQVSFFVLPDAFKSAPFFSRITMWRKFRGHAVIGANTAAVNAAAGPRGRGGSIFQRSQRGGRGRGSMDGGRGFGPPGGFVMPPGRPPMGGFPGGGMMQYPPRYGPPGYR